MKKLLLITLIILLLALTTFTVMYGANLGQIEILGYEGIVNKNEELDKKIEEATRLASIEYPKKLSEIDTNFKNLNEQKTTYEDMVSVSTDDEVRQASQFGKYTLEFLYAEIGTHQKRDGIDLKMDIWEGNGAKDTYNIEFTATGSYVGIESFLVDIEDDTSLGFKIEEFYMRPGNSTDSLVATFKWKNIQIEGISEVNSTTDTENSNTENSNSTNTTNTNSTNNTNTRNNSNTNSTGNTNTGNSNTTQNQANEAS